MVGALGYAYSYVAFTATVVYSFVEQTPDWVALTRRLGPWFLVHGAIMVAAGLCLGLAVVRAGVLPRWTGHALMIGVTLVAVTTDMPDPVRTGSAAVRAAAFIGTGHGDRASTQCACTSRAGTGVTPLDDGSRIARPRKSGVRPRLPRPGVVLAACVTPGVTRNGVDDRDLRRHRHCCRCRW